MRIRIGLIGFAEAWPSRHAPSLRALADRFEVRAVYDPVARRAEQAAEPFGANVVAGYRALIDREDVDAVMILAPHWYGMLPILAACDASKAIYCAAGLDLTPEEARQVKRRVEESGVAFVAEFVRRHMPATIRLKELIASRLGAPRLLFCHQRTAAARRNGHPQPAQDPALRELLELIDWCCYVVDQPPRLVTGIVHAPTDGTTALGADYHMLSLDFSEAAAGTGPVAQISCGRYIPSHWQEAINYRPPASLQVACANGVAFVDLPSTVVWFDEAGRHQEHLDSDRPVGEQMLLHFHRAITSLVRRTSDLEDAYRALQIVQESRNSHRRGCRIELPR